MADNFNFILPSRIVPEKPKISSVLRSVDSLASDLKALITQLP